MTLRQVVLALAVLSLSACTTFPDISQSRSPCRLEPGGWCAFVREAAVDAYPYAIAATNAYAGDDDVFADIGPNLKRLDRLAVLNDDLKRGFDYQVFEQVELEPTAFGWFSSIVPDRTFTKARILAFRGTDFDGLTDIFYGTLRNDQIELALEYFERERARFPDDGIPWIVTGHSLGGALATEVSIRYPEVRAYMFNTSPFYGGDAMTNDNRRTVFNERGEVLRRFARYDAAPAADLFTINCGPANSTFSKHKIRPLADCITWIAAYESEGALAVIRANAKSEFTVSKPMVECGPDDKPHPGVGHLQIEPCVHQSRKADGD